METLREVVGQLSVLIQFTQGPDTVGQILEIKLAKLFSWLDGPFAKEILAVGTTFKIQVLKAVVG